MHLQPGYWRAARKCKGETLRAERYPIGRSYRAEYRTTAVIRGGMRVRAERYRTVLPPLLGSRFGLARVSTRARAVRTQEVGHERMP